MLSSVKMKKCKLSTTIFLDEWQLTKDVILAIEGYDELLAENSYLKDSLNYRMPYFNILNYIQLELIKRQRRGELSVDEEKTDPYNYQRNCKPVYVIQADMLQTSSFFQGKFF